MSFAAISKYLMPKRSHLATVLDCSRVEAAMVDFSWTKCDFLGDSILVWRYVFRVEGIMGSNIPRLVSHFILIASLHVRFLKVFDCFRIYAHFLGANTRLHLFLIQLEVNLGSKRSEILVKTLLAPQRMVGVKNIKWLAVNLVARCHHLVRHQHLLRRPFWLHHIWK